MGSDQKRFTVQAHFSVQHSVFACHVLDELRRFSTIGVTHVHYFSLSHDSIEYYSEGSTLPSPPGYVLPYLFLMDYFHSSLSSLFQYFSLSFCCFRLYVSMCLSPLSCPPPSLPDSWLVWQHQAACIFSIATDGAMAETRMFFVSAVRPFPGTKMDPVRLVDPPPLFSKFTVLIVSFGMAK